ncbi:ankyrin-2-like [Saccostrea cucullata]|uniref:ankyrin-2-like n=1 Tax=Saccostrea cuccullata TaxID=36930 RepID=UPI002ED47F02
MVKFLLKIIRDEKQRYNALNQSALMNHSNVVQILLDEGVTPDTKSCFCAIQNGNKDIVVQIINTGLDLSQVSESRHPLYDNNSVSILAESCLWERLELISFLLKICPALSNEKNDVGDSTIHFVAYSGATDALNSLIVDHKCNPYLKTHLGASILHCACENGKLETAKYIMSQYPDLLNEEHDLYRDGSILHMAAAGGNIELFHIFKKQKMTISSETGQTVLHTACRYGRFEMSKMLLDRFPHLLTVKDINGNSVLHTAAWGGNTDLLKYLLKKKLNIDEKQNEGKTVLNLCCYTGKIEMCKYLVKTYPYLLDITDNNGQNVLHDAALGGNVDLIIFLVEKGLDIKSTGNDGSTVLHQCCNNGKMNMCKYLVNTYPDLLHVTYKDGLNALHGATWSGNVDLIIFLVEKGLDIKSTRNDGSSVLHLCCLKRNINMCKYLVNTYSDLLYVTNNNGESALHKAAWSGYVDLVIFLVEKGLDIKCTRNDGSTVLHLCCLNSKTDICKYLVNTYPDLLNVTDNNGQNALHDAAWSGNVEILKFLLDKGSDINIARKDGKTVLHLCCLNSKIVMCKYLVNTYPFLLDVTDIDGGNALHDAAWSGNVEILKFLLEKGLDIKCTRKDGSSVLHLCCLKRNIDMCKYLVNTYPFLLDVTDIDGGNALHDAAWSGNIKILTFLLEKGLDIKCTGKDGSSVLHLCCLKRNIDMCKYLVNTYSDLLYVTNNNGENALHKAAQSGYVYLVIFLVEKGLDIKCTRNDGSTVLHLCCLNSKIDMCKYLVNTYPDLLNVTDNNGQNALHDAAWSGNVEILKFLLDKGSDINSARKDGKTVLHLCCLNSKIDMCKYLVNTYPFLLDVTDIDGGNALHDAAWSCNVEILKFLLGKGLDIKCTRNDGSTVLHLCCLNSKIDMCKYLVNTYPFLLDVTDNNGQNALHDAAWSGNVEILKFLLDKGSDINIARKGGKTVLHQCCLNSKIDMCKYLVNTYPFLLDITDNNGVNALHGAAWSGNFDLVIFLLEKDLDIKSTINNGKTVLHLCCMNGKKIKDMCKYLANTYPFLLDVTDNNGENALHSAAWGGDIDLFKFLLEKGLNINTARNDGKTVLHMCCINREIVMYKFLVEMYPNLVDVEDKYGNEAVLYGL